MIRNNEMSREEALKIYNDDSKTTIPENYEFIKTTLNLTESEIAKIEKIPLNEFNYKISPANIIFAKIRRVVKKNEH